ncbi:MAG: YraN family protein [Thermodesulfobacteriota bacterium]
MSLFRKELGERGEKEAIRALKRDGYRIVERNYRCVYGEIDIIATDAETLAFIEVKTRSNKAFGVPAEAVDKRKQGRIIKSSMQYLSEVWKGSEPLSRFDVVSVEVEPDKGGKFKIEIIKDAFSIGA